jgi:hypothetical protein
MSAKTPNNKRMWGMYVIVSIARDAAGGRLVLPVPFRPPRAYAVPRVQTTAVTIAVTRLLHQGVSAYNELEVGGF